MTNSQPALVATDDPNAPIVLTGTVLATLYSSDDGPYTVTRLRLDEGGHPLVVVGRYPSLATGEAVAVTGTWQRHPSYGRQLRASSVRLIRPATAEAIRRFLNSPLVPGVGPVMAARIVDHFGVESLDILDHDIDRLREIGGVGPVRAAQIGAAWANNAPYRDVLLALFDLGISHSRGMAIYLAFKEQAPLVVRSQPYRLARTVRGIGFKTADAIAQKIGIPQDAPARIEAGIAHVLQQAAQEGHAYLPADALTADARLLLGEEITVEALDAAITRLTTDHDLVVHDRHGLPSVYLPAFDRAEQALAYRLLALSVCPEENFGETCAAIDGKWERALDDVRPKVGADLAPEQRAAVRLAFEHRVTILTGGPGTGKTMTIRAMVTLVAAPTGRAARRMAEVTGLPAVTLHRLLKLGFAAASRDDADVPDDGSGTDEEPSRDVAPVRRPGNSRASGKMLDGDLIIVDEMSMVDLSLANALSRALPHGAHLVLVGDPDQLPSVRTGRVLHDLLEAGLFPTTRLRRIFRQGEGSGIAENAARINAGEMPVWWPANDVDDFFVFHEPDAERGVDLLVDIVTRRLVAKYGFTHDDIQVLTPTHRGLAGVPALNERLQVALNPPTADLAELVMGGRVLRVGDRVVQMKNNYDLDVYNGDLGKVVEIDAQRYLLRVVLDDGTSRLYAGQQLADLAHSYAMTIHKAQGGEFPVVVLPILPAQYILLSRRLLYTAVTRARKLVVLVGQTRAISMAVRDAGVEERYSGLVSRLRDLDAHTVRTRLELTVRTSKGQKHRPDKQQPSLFLPLVL